MPDPGLVALVATALGCGVILRLLLRRSLRLATPVRGLLLAPVVVVSSFAATRLQGHGVTPGLVPDALVNRLLAGVVLLAAGAFLLVNRRQGSGALRWGIGSTAAGAVSNATAMLAFGSMPLFVPAVRAEGGWLLPGEHPAPRYVAVDGSRPVAVVLGDVLPLPPFGIVVSLGDLLLAAGCAVLLSYFATILVSPRQPKQRNGAGAAAAVAAGTVPASAVAGSTPADSAS